MELVGAVAIAAIQPRLHCLGRYCFCNKTVITARNLLQMASDVNNENYCWQAGKVKQHGMHTVIYLLGYPDEKKKKKLLRQQQVNSTA
jgi:hypothetical protein